jgi:DNA-3-methyladenine glycosylase
VTGERPFPRAALLGPAPDVAAGLLGAALVGPGVRLMIVEVEAYGPDDPASHAARGPTPRCATMFGPPGHLYAYVSHGIHVCANVSTGAEGHGAAVLLRAARVLEGHDTAVGRRGGRGVDEPRLLAGGPGRLGQVLGLGREDDGVDLCGGQGPLQLRGTVGPPPTAVVRRGPRVGVRRAADRPWRLHLDGEPAVSRYRRHPGAPPRSER